MYVSDYIIIIDIFDMMQLKKPTGLQYSCIESLNWEAWDGWATQPRLTTDGS